MAALVGATLGWSAEEQATHVATYRAEIERERRALEMEAEPSGGDRAARQPGWVPGVRLPRRLNRAVE